MRPGRCCIRRATYNSTAIVISPASTTYRTPLLKSIGPTLNQVSSLNSLVGVKTPLATSGALCGLKPKTAMKKISPPSQRPTIARASFLPLLIPCFGSLAAGVGGDAAIALISRRAPRGARSAI